MKKYFVLIIGFIIIGVTSGCGDKIDAPTANTNGEVVLGDTLYIPLSPAWDAAHDYGFSSPEDVHVGRDTYIYVADTGNDRVIRLDAGGTVLASYTGIPHPKQITQDELMRLIVINGTRSVYKIDVGPGGDGIPVVCYDASTPEDSGFISASEVFTGVGHYPSINKLYFLSVSSSVTTSGKVVLMEGKGAGDFSDEIMDSVIASDSDTLYNPVVEYGLGAGYASHPNCLYSFARNDSLFLLMTQDSSTFKAQLLTIRLLYNTTYGFRSAFNPSGNVDMYELDFFIQPEDACVDVGGNIYIVDAGISAPYGAYKFNSKGELKESFGPPGNDSDELSNPMGIAYDDNNDRKTVYIADTGNNRIVRYKLNTDLE
ncbi:MAG: hypothetical protein GY855_14630 [candidate division Zixibacteria bacterium]|nr:hypothetical protein [candidate division Zixibacteria bacterium]